MKFRVLASSVIMGSIATGALAQTQLTFINCGSPTSESAGPQMDAIAEWEAMNPEYDVNAEYLPWGQCQERTTTLAAAGNPPAMAYVGSRLLKSLALNKMILPIPFSEEEVATYPAPVLGTVTFDGAQWGIPRAFSSKALYWNRAIFAEAGLPTDRGPQTWEEVLTASRAIAENTDAVGFGMVGASFDNTAFQFLKWAFSNNAEVFDEDGVVVFDSPEMVAAMEFYKELSSFSQPGPIAYNRSGIEPLFVEGQVAMMVSGPWARNALVEMDYGTELILAGPSGEQVSFLITDSIAIFDGSEMEDAALSLAKHLTTPDRQFAFERDFGLTPLRITDGVNQMIEDDSTWKIFVDAIAVGIPEPLIVEYVGMQDAIIEAVQSVILGDEEPADAVRMAAESLSDLQ